MSFNQRIIDDLLGIRDKSIEDVIYATEYFMELIQLKFEYVMAHSDKYSTDDVNNLSNLLQKVIERNEEARQLYEWLNDKKYEPSDEQRHKLFYQRQELLLAELRRMVDNWDESEDDL